MSSPNFARSILEPSSEITFYFPNSLKIPYLTASFSSRISWPILSLSITSKWGSACSSLATVDFPHAIPPVSPMTHIWFPSNKQAKEKAQSVQMAQNGSFKTFNKHRTYVNWMRIKMVRVAILFTNGDYFVKFAFILWYFKPLKNAATLKRTLVSKVSRLFTSIFII